MELDFRRISGICTFAFGTLSLLLARSFVWDQVAASSAEAENYACSCSAAAQDLELEYVRLLL